MGKKRKPIQYVKTSKTGAAAYDPNTGQYLPQQYLPTVEITADRALPFQNGKFAPWLASKGIAEYVPVEAALLPSTPYIRGLGKFGNFALDAVNPLAGDGLLSKEGVREFIKQGADKASESSLKDFMIKTKAAFNKGPEGKFGRYADIRKGQIERGRLAWLTGTEDSPARTPEYPLDVNNTKVIANRGMDYYVRNDASPIPSVSNPWLTQADPGDVVREMGRTSYAKDIPESDQYLAWQNWERYKSMITDPRNAQLLPIHEMRNKIVQNIDAEKIRELNSNIGRKPLRMGSETLNSTMGFRPSLPSGSYSTGAGNTFSTGDLGPNSFVTNADVPSTHTSSEYNMLPNFIYDFRKPPSRQIDISKELGRGSYSATGINPSPLVSDPNFLLKGSRSDKVQHSFMTNAEDVYNSPDFAREYVQAYDAYRKGYDIAPIVGAKVPDNPNDMMLELMPRIQGQNLFSTRLQTPSGRTIRITDKDVAYKRLANADVKRFGEQTHLLDKDFYFDPIGDNIMLGNDNRLYHIDMFPKLSNFKTRMLGQDPAPIMNSYKGSVLEKITSGLPAYETVQRDVDKGFITKSMADKMLENSMRIGNDFVEGAKLGQSDIDFNIDSNSLYAYGLNGLKRFGGGGNLKQKPKPNPLMNIPEDMRLGKGKKPLRTVTYPKGYWEYKRDSNVPLNLLGQPYATGAIEESISPLDFISGVRGAANLINGVVKYTKTMKPNYIQIGDELFNMGPPPRAVRRATNQIHKGAQQIVSPSLFKKGGEITPKPPVKEEEVKPIYTTDPKDPRLLAYQDSLSLYNVNPAPKKYEYYFDGNYDKRTGVDWSKSLKNEKIKPVGHWYLGNNEYRTAYKKPAQPVVYKPGTTEAQAFNNSETVAITPHNDYLNQPGGVFYTPPPVTATHPTTPRMDKMPMRGMPSTQVNATPQYTNIPISPTFPLFMDSEGVWNDRPQVPPKSDGTQYTIKELERMGYRIPKMYTGGGMDYFANRQRAMQQGDSMGNAVASIFPIAGAFKALGQGVSSAIAPKDEYGVSSRGDFAVGLAGGIDPLESTTSAFNDIQGGKFDSTTAWNLAFPPVGAVLQNRKNREMRDQMLGSLQSKVAPSMSAGFTNAPSIYATGGSISNRTPNSFIQYNGPGHEDGGIPVTADGMPAPRHMADAEVEGGETSYKSYVYSDRLKDPKTGKTFADLSKAISRRYGDTSDPISAKGFEMEMSRLMASNEEIRIKKEMNSYKRRLKNYLPEKAWGGLTKDQWTQAGIQNAGNIANLAYNMFSKPAKYPFYNNTYAGQIAGNPQLLDPASELARANDTYTGLKRSLPSMTGGQSAGLGALRLMAARQRDTGNAAIYDRYNQANVGIRENRMNRLLQLGEYDRQAKQWSFDNTQKGKANKDNQIFADVNAIGANIGNMYNQAAWNKMLEDPRKSWMEWQYSQNTAQDPAGNMVSVKPGYQGAIDGPSFIGGNYPVNTPYTGAPKFNPNFGIPAAPKAPAYYPPYEDNLAPWQLSGPRMRKGGMLYAY